LRIIQRGKKETIFSIRPRCSRLSCYGREGGGGHERRGGRQADRLEEEVATVELADDATNAPDVRGVRPAQLQGHLARVSGDIEEGGRGRRVHLRSTVLSRVDDGALVFVIEGRSTKVDHCERERARQTETVRRAALRVDSTASDLWFARRGRAGRCRPRGGHRETRRGCSPLSDLRRARDGGGKKGEEVARGVTVGGCGGGRRRTSVDETDRLEEVQHFQELSVRRGKVRAGERWEEEPEREERGPWDVSDEAHGIATVVILLEDVVERLSQQLRHEAIESCRKRKWSVWEGRERETERGHRTIIFEMRVKFQTATLLGRLLLEVDGVEDLRLYLGRVHIFPDVPHNFNRHLFLIFEILTLEYLPKGSNANFFVQKIWRETMRRGAEADSDRHLCWIKVPASPWKCPMVSSIPLSPLESRFLSESGLWWRDELLFFVFFRGSVNLW
jgi:hypothetical protein